MATKVKKKSQKTEQAEETKSQTTRTPEQAALDAVYDPERDGVIHGEERDRLTTLAIRHHERLGRPEVAWRLRSMYKNGKNITRHMVDLEVEFPFSEKEPLPVQPARTGTGATREAWIAFARHVAGDSIGDTVIEDVTRDDLIRMLEVNGYIDPVS